MFDAIRCPSCAMVAQRGDHRQWIPLRTDGDDRRRCRNCGADVDLASAFPRLLHPTR